MSWENLVTNYATVIIIITISCKKFDIFFFLFVVEAVGCYRDSSRARAIPNLVHNYRGQIDWYNIGTTIEKCANVAQGKGYKVSWWSDRLTSFSSEINFYQGNSNLHVRLLNSIIED